MGKRGGYRREKPVYKLIFADEEFDGLEVMAKSLPLGEFMELQKLQARATEDPGAAEKIVRTLGRVLVSWNLEDDDGKPVPAEYAVCATSGKPGNPGQLCSADQAGPGDEGDPGDPCQYAGLVGEDPPFVLAIFQAWMQVVASVPNSSPNDSNDGGTSPEQSIPMDPP
jgi:hypothetical protein